MVGWRVKRPKKIDVDIPLKILNDQNRRVMQDYGEYIKRTAFELDKIVNAIAELRQEVIEIRELYEQVFKKAMVVTNE